MSKPLRVAIAGLGTVGGGTAKLLHENAALIAQRAGRVVELVAVGARNPNKVRIADVSGAEWVTDVMQLADRSDIDVVVELIGGAEGIAYDLCSRALMRGKSVVTANKAMIATHGAALARMAQDHGGHLLFEAAVAGGIPVLKTLREALAGNRILSVRGILNGTCNYILTRMDREGSAFDAVLADAQKLGYAEADPSADIDGLDAAHKIAILASLCFGVAPDLQAVTRRGLRDLTPTDFHYAAELGYKIKLIGSARLSVQGLAQSVEPCLVPLSSPLAQTDDVLNAVEIQGDAVGALFLRGRGAGSAATASAVVGDLVDLARGCAACCWSAPSQDLQGSHPLAPKDREGRWYIRIHAHDQPGVLSLISGILGKENISIESALQHGRDGGQDFVPIILTTHETNLAAMQMAVERLEGLACVCARPYILKIESDSF